MRAPSPSASRCRGQPFPSGWSAYAPSIQSAWTDPAHRLRAVRQRLHISPPQYGQAYAWPGDSARGAKWFRSNSWCELANNSFAGLHSDDNRSARPGCFWHSIRLAGSPAGSPHGKRRSRDSAHIENRASPTTCSAAPFYIFLTAYRSVERSPPPAPPGFPLGQKAPDNPPDAPDKAPHNPFPPQPAHAATPAGPGQSRCGNAEIDLHNPSARRGRAQRYPPR